VWSPKKGLEPAPSPPSAAPASPPCAGGTEESGSSAELKVDFEEAQVSAVSASRLQSPLERNLPRNQSLLSLR